MRSLHRSRKSYAIAATIGIVGTCAGLYAHHWSASRAPVSLSVRSVAGRLKGAATVQTGAFGARHSVQVPVEITFGLDGKAVTRAGAMMVADTRSDYAVQGQSLVFSHVLVLRGNRVLHDPVERHASIEGETLTLRDPGKPTVVLYRD